MAMLLALRFNLLLRNVQRQCGTRVRHSRMLLAGIQTQF
jgi:hypothetical protein